MWLVMMTSTNGNIFRVTGPLCGEFTGPGEFPTQRPVTRSFDVFFHLRLNKRLSKQPWGWWFETLYWSLWRHRNDLPPTTLLLDRLGHNRYLLNRYDFDQSYGREKSLKNVSAVLYCTDPLVINDIRGRGQCYDRARLNHFFTNDEMHIYVTKTTETKLRIKIYRYLRYSRFKTYIPRTRSTRWRHEMETFSM